MSTSTRFRAGTRRAKHWPSLRTTHASDRMLWPDDFRCLFEDAPRGRRTLAHPADCFPGGRGLVESAGARAKARSDKGRDAGSRARR